MQQGHAHCSQYVYSQLGYKRYYLFKGTFLRSFARFRQVATRWHYVYFLTILLSYVNQSDSVLYSCAWLPEIQSNSVSPSSPFLFTANMACYGGYNLWSVDCGCIIRNSFSSQGLCVWCPLSFWFSYYNKRVTIFRLLLSCVLPLCVIAFFYIMMSCHLLKSRYSLSETHNARQNTRKNTAKVMLGITLVFLFSYLPFQIFQTYLYSNMNLENPLAEVTKEMLEFERFWMLASLLGIFLSINSYLNPVALFCTSLVFRRHFKRYLMCCCKSKSPPTVLELKRKNWVCNLSHYFLPTPLGNIFHSNFLLLFRVRIMKIA